MSLPFAIIFDAFGTLFDVRGVDAACEAAFPGYGARLGRIWRAKQLQYSWLRSLMDSYQDFESVTSDALVAACRQLGLNPDAARQQHLSDGYRNLPAHPEVPAALLALDRAGCRLAILSNGTPAQLRALVEHAGLPVNLDLLSAHAVRVFKPHPLVYRLPEERFGVSRSRLLFVSSNAWDIAGAGTYGLPCAWLNRAGVAPEELGPEPAWVGAGLDQLATEVSASG